MLILFYSTMWGQLPDGVESLPAGCEVTTDRRRIAEAAAVVFHIPTLRRWWPLPRRRPGQIWVAWFLECEAHDPRLRDPSFLRRFELTMTYHPDSDVPCPYIDQPDPSMRLAATLRTSVLAKTAPVPAASFVSSRFDRSGRRAYLAELSRHMPIHHYGTFLRTHTLAPDRGRITKCETIARYPFTIAFENAIAADYVTEKFFDPLVVGSVPVYLGAPNIERFAPAEHCFVNAADAPEPRHLAEVLLSLWRDPERYASYLAWKSRPFRPSFEELLALRQRSTLVRLCERIRLRTRDNASQLSSFRRSEGA